MCHTVDKVHSKVYYVNSVIFIKIKSLLMIEERILVSMIEDYLTIKETAKKWGITPKRVQVLCVSERIEGAVKFGREWAIPINAERPLDKRVTTGKYRNWRKKK